MKLTNWETLDVRIGVSMPPQLADRLDAYAMEYTDGDVSKALRTFWKDILDSDIEIEKYREKGTGMKYTVRISKELLAKVDKLRGKVSRSVVLRSITAAALNNRDMERTQ